MNLSIWLFSFASILGALFYHQVPLIISNITIGIFLIFSIVLGSLSVLSFLILFIPFIAIAIILNNSNIRKNLLLKPVFDKIIKQVPIISETEKTALDAGTTHFDAELFTGKPDFDKILNLPASSLTTEEQTFLDNQVENLCDLIDDWEIFVKKDIPEKIWQYLKSEKFFALSIPKKFGGLEFSATAHSVILSKIAVKSTTVATTVAVPNSLGPAELLLHYGTKEQQDYYLPRLAKGEEIPCFALTNPKAGSDATSIPDTGIIKKQNFNGKETIGILLNWDKRYITLAPKATILGLAFKLIDPDNLISDKKELGITCALIPTNTKGIEIGSRHFPLAAMFLNGPTKGKDVFIPMDWIIGGQEMIGKGWRMLVECLSCGRAISLPSISAGKINMAALASGAYSRIRKQFGQAIAKFEGIEDKLSSLIANTYIANSSCLLTTKLIDNGEKPSVLGAILKYHITELSRQSIIDAMDIHAGKAIILGPKNYLADSYMSSPISITVEGANILTRNLIIFGQGAIRCHPYIKSELKALQNQDKKIALDKFDNLIWKHIGFIISSAIRSFFFALTKGKLIRKPTNGSLSYYYQNITWCSSVFALLTDVSLILLGSKLKFKEKLSARLGDLLSYMYFMTCCLKQFNDDDRPNSDKILVKYIMKDLLYKFFMTTKEILQNLPNKYIGFLLNIIIFPLGFLFKKPSDKLGSEVAKLLTTPNETRNRLLEKTYINANEQNPFGKLELALKQIIAAEPIEKRINQSVKENILQSSDLNNIENLIKQAIKISLITEPEAMILRQAETARDEVIAVDDFKS